MYNKFIKPFSLSKAIQTKFFYLKNTKLNLKLLKLFKLLGLITLFEQQNHSLFRVMFLKHHHSMIYNNFQFFKKNSLTFIFSLKSINFLKKNTKSVALFSTNNGLELSTKAIDSGGKLVMIYRR